jgi:hypothetical protein
VYYYIYKHSQFELTGNIKSHTEGILHYSSHTGSLYKYQFKKKTLNLSLKVLLIVLRIALTANENGIKLDEVVLRIVLVIVHIEISLNSIPHPTIS